MSTIRLHNSGREAFIVVLTHEIYCAGGGPCACTRGVAHVAAYEDRAFAGFRETKRIAPATTTLPPGGSHGGFHPLVFRLPAIANALKTGWLRSSEDPSEAAPASVDASAPPTDAPPSTTVEAPVRGRRRHQVEETPGGGRKPPAEG